MLDAITRGAGKILPLALVAKNRFFLGLVGGCASILLLFFSYRGHVTAFGPKTGKVAGRAARFIVQTFPDYKESGLNPVLVFPFQGPKGAIMADLLRDELDNSGRYDVIGKGVVESSIRTLKIDLPQLGEDDARAYGVKLQAAAVITGRMLQVDETTTPPILEVQASMTAVDGSRAWTVEFPPRAATADSAYGQEPESESVFWPAVGDWFLRCVGFLLLALSTPLLLYPLTKSFLKKETNAANAAMLILYAVLDTAILIVVSLTFLSPVSGAVVAFMAFAAALWLNYVVSSALERWSR